MADEGMVLNPKLLAIESLSGTVSTSMKNLDISAVSGGQVDVGLTSEVWSSPVADGYRTKISDAMSKADGAFIAIKDTVGRAIRQIRDAEKDMVPADSPEAKWPDG